MNMALATAMFPVNTPDTPKEIAKSDLRRLFTRDESGHIGHYGYLGKGAQIVDEFYTTHPAYYLNRGEVALLTENAEIVANKIKETERLIIIGPGPSLKEEPLLPHLPYLSEIVLIDVEKEFCDHSQFQLKGLFNKIGRHNVKISALVSDFHDAPSILPPSKNTTVITTGSLISNVPQKSNERFPEAQILLALSKFRELAGNDGRVVLGYDSCQSPFQIQESYNHPAFDRFVLHCVGQAFDVAKINSITSKNITDYFERRTHTGRGVTPHHNVVAKTDMHFDFRAAGSKKPIQVPISKGDEFTVLYSVKPLPHQITALSQNIGMSRGWSMTSDQGLTLHVLKVG